MGAVRTRYLAPTIPICTLHWTLTYLGTSMYIGPHTCMSGYVSAYHGVGKLCILLHTILCHAVLEHGLLQFDKAEAIKNQYPVGALLDASGGGQPLSLRIAASLSISMLYFFFPCNIYTSIFTKNIQTSKHTGSFPRKGT